MSQLYLHTFCCTNATAQWAKFTVIVYAIWCIKAFFIVGMDLTVTVGFFIPTVEFYKAKQQ